MNVDGLAKDPLDLDLDLDIDLDLVLLLLKYFQLIVNFGFLSLSNNNIPIYLHSYGGPHHVSCLNL